MSDQRGESAAPPYDGVIEVPFNPEDQGVFGLSAERVWRFLANRYVDESINNTSGPIDIVTVGAGFPLQAEMQRLEQLKRCDSIAGSVQRALNTPLDTMSIGKMKRILGESWVSTGMIDAARRTVHSNRPLVRATLVDALYNAPPKISGDAKATNEHIARYETALVNTDKQYVREYELETKPGEGRWETLKAEPVGTTLLYELTAAMMNETRARSFIRYLAGQLTNLSHTHMRPFKVTSLDWRDPSDLRAAAQLALDHPDIFDTQLVQRAAEFKDHQQQAHPFDLSALPDKSVTCLLVNHWPRYDDVFHATGDARVSPMNFIIELNRVIKPGGTAVFFPWQLPTQVVQGRPSFILGQAEDILMKDGFEVRAKADSAAAVIKAAASYGREAMTLSPQLRAAGHIITFAATKRLQTLADRVDTSPSSYPDDQV